jgi:hypothetical protein
MNIIKQTTHKLILGNEEKTTREDYEDATILFVFYLLVFCFIFTGFIFFDGGKKILKCNRIEPKLVNCNYTNHKLFSLIKMPVIETGLVKEAKLTSETKEDDDGNSYKVHSITLVNVNGQGNNLHKSRDFDEISRLTLGINNFINSNLPSLIIKHNYGFEALKHKYVYFFTVLFLIVLADGLMVIDSFKIEHIILDKDSAKFTHKEKYFTHEKIKQHKLSEITKLEQNETECEDGTFYDLVFVLSSGKHYKIIRDTKIEKIQSMKQEIEEFLPHLKR